MEDFKWSFVLDFFFKQKKFWVSIFWYAAILCVLLSNLIRFGWLYAIIIAIIWVAAVFLYRYSALLKRLKSEKRLFDKIVWEVTPERWEGKGESYRLGINNKDFIKVVENKYFLYLFTTVNGFTLIPKKNISLEDLALIRTFLKINSNDR